jgi:L-arabinonolactonase
MRSVANVCLRRLVSFSDILVLRSGAAVRFQYISNFWNWSPGVNRVGTVECVLDCHAELAEGPVWDPQDNVLYWVNIKSHEIHRYDPVTGKDQQWPTPMDVGSVALRRDGGMIVALKTGFFLFDPPTARFTPIAAPEPGLPDNRFNDGKTDRQGRFWAGSLHDPETAPTGSLYRLDTDLSCHKMVEGIYASNGLAFSPDSATAYFADSRRRIVWAWDFDQADGALRNRRVFIELRGSEGAPDGAAVDTDGGYWLAQPPAGRVVRYDPRGRIDRVLELPVSQPTCVAFGGARMDTLYITSAKYRMAPDELKREPLAGAIFAAYPGVTGLPDVRFDG